MSKQLNEILEDFEELRSTYRIMTTKGDTNSLSLLEFQSRFTDLKSDIRPHIAVTTREWTKRDDKAATAIKYRLCVAISKGEHPDFDSCSINQAEKYAAGCKEYKEFVDQRSFWKESLANLNSLRDDVSSYLIEISTRLKH